MEDKKQGLKKLRTKGKYVVLACIPKGVKPEDIQGYLNKIELDFKTFGIKNIKAIPQVSSILEVEEE